MQLPWLEALVKQGSVTAEQRDEIYADCQRLVKESSLTPDQIIQRDALAAKMMGVYKTVAGATLPFMPMIMTRFLGKRDEKKSVATAVAEMERVKAELLKHDDFGDKDKVEARFNEIAQLAPTVARNKPLMHKLLKEKLNSGLTAEDVHNLALIQASYTPNYSYQQKITKTAAAEALGETAADMVLVCAEAGLLKTAGNVGIGRILRHSLMMTAGPALVGLGVGSVNQLADMKSRRDRERKLSDSFHQAVNGDHPDRALLQANRDKAYQAFQTLAHFAPSVAMQPTAARSFMKKLVDYKGDVHSGDLKDLTEIEKNMRGQGSTPFLKGLGTGAEAAGVKDAVKSTINTLTGARSYELERDLASNLGLKPGKGHFMENVSSNG